MADVFDLIEHLNQHPPAYRVLGWRYGLKPVTAPRGQGGPTAPLKDAEVGELSQTLGVMAQPMPQHIREMALWAAEQGKRLTGTGKSSG